MNLKNVTSGLDRHVEWGQRREDEDERKTKRYEGEGEKEKEGGGRSGRRRRMYQKTGRNVTSGLGNRHAAQSQSVEEEEE